MSLFDLTDRCIVVTGSRGLLGRPICAALAAAGARVVGLDLFNTSDPERHYYTYACDLTNLESVRWAEGFLRGDGLIAAGLVLLHGLDQKPEGSGADPWRDWDDLLSVNLTATKNACRVFGSLMARAGRGSIITTGSLYATLSPDQRLYADGFVKSAGYSVSKAGGLGLTRYLAGLWGSAGVRVNCLSPGGIGSESTPPDFRERFEQRVPLGRMGTPGDLVGAIIWLLSDASAYVSGQEIRVDGGCGLWP